MVYEVYKTEAFEMAGNQLPTLMLTIFTSVNYLQNIVVEKGAELIINNKSFTI